MTIRSTYHSGTLTSPHAARSLDDALAAARASKKAVTHSILVDKLSNNEEYKELNHEEMVLVCIDTATSGHDADECFLHGETESDGWGM